MLEFLLLSIILCIIWTILFTLKSNLRKEMILASIFTMPFGLTEPLFVPKYWNPDTLFNLAKTTGFDIESLIFSFMIGGIGAVLYEMFFKVKHIKITKHEMHMAKHKIHHLALSSPAIIFLILFFTIKLNPIYLAIISMFFGALATLYCRPDLKNKIWIGGFLFLLVYFISFLFIILIYPNWVQTTWNLNKILNILILGIPLEELMFAFTFGMLWSSVYEHFKWYKLKKEVTNG